MMVKDQLSLKNPFFEHGEGVVFTAYRSGWCSGAARRRSTGCTCLVTKTTSGSSGSSTRSNDEDVANALIARRQAVAQEPRHETHPRPAVALRERRARVSHRRLRHASDVHDAASSRVPGRPHREVRATEDQRLLRLALRSREGSGRAPKRRPARSNSSPRSRRGTWT